LIVKLKYSSK